MSTEDTLTSITVESIKIFTDSFHFSDFSYEKLDSISAPSEDFFSGSISFKGDLLSGVIKVNTCKDFLKNSYPNEDIPDDELLGDWCGEICNIALGNFKRLCSDYSIKFQMYPPVNKNSFSTEKMTGKSLAHYLFKMDKGDLYLSASLDYDPNLTLKKNPPSSKPNLSSDFLIEL